MQIPPRAPRDAAQSGRRTIRDGANGSTGGAAVAVSWTNETGLQTNGVPDDICTHYYGVAHEVARIALGGIATRRSAPDYPSAARGSVPDLGESAIAPPCAKQVAGQAGLVVFAPRQPWASMSGQTCARAEGAKPSASRIFRLVSIRHEQPASTLSMVKGETPARRASSALLIIASCRSFRTLLACLPAFGPVRAFLRSGFAAPSVSRSSLAADRSESGSGGVACLLGDFDSFTGFSVAKASSTISLRSGLDSPLPRERAADRASDPVFGESPS